MDAYHAAIARLDSLKTASSWKHNNLATLEASMLRVRQLLTRLGNPEATMRYIHVTGTSGKGSVTNLIHNMLLTDGRNVASYSSPHTTTLLERFRVGEKLIAPGKLVTAIDAVLAANEENCADSQTSATYFELVTCIAFVAFANANVEWCVLEVGLGGRWDATNVIPSKDVAVITNIGLDHTDVLGPTYAHIAREKVGIITGPCTVISGEDKPEIRTIISDAAESHASPIHFVDAPDDNHQLHNALIATATARAVNVPMERIEQAIESGTGLPCRFEIIQQKPLVIIDGAHNVAKMHSTITTLQRIQQGNIYVIFGCKSGKDAPAMLTELAANVDTIFFTQYAHGYGPAEDPIVLQKLVPQEKYGPAFPAWRDALSHVLVLAKDDDTILITGSLYLAGEMRTHWVSEEEILAAQSSLVRNLA